MKSDIVSVNPLMPVETGSGVSFNMFIDFINQRINLEQGSRRYFYKNILDRFKQYPELTNSISINKTGKYEDILQLISSCVVPVLEDENEMLWAFGKTFSPQIFYGSDAFYKLIYSINIHTESKSRIEKGEAIQLDNELRYSLILEKIYGIKTFFNREWIHRIINPETGLYQYYRMTIDWRFAGLEINGPLPNFHSASLETCSNVEEALELLHRQIPLHLFKGMGFTIISLTDVTPHQALKQMARVSIYDNELKAAGSMQQVNSLLQTIVGSNAYQFGFMPFLNVNQRPAVLYDKFQFSIIADTCHKREVSKGTFTSFINILRESPGIKTYRKTTGTNLFPEEIQNAFKQAGIGFYMTFPAYYNNQAVGILEVSSNKESIQFTEQQLSDLQPAIHIISRLIQQIMNKFNLRIENIVKDKFTNIQPSVQWKFNEVAWHYVKDNYLKSSEESIESVSFNDLHPLYGAVDIRNSTIERNIALQEDLKTRILLLTETLKRVPALSWKKEIYTINFTCNKWLKEHSIIFNEEDEVRFNNFLKTDVDSLLQAVLRTSPDLAELIGRYYSATDELTGIAFSNMRKLELSMKVINDEINRFYEDAKGILQKIYPCYFDKFRTDGVEYDIYIGQSIAPKIPFKNEHLKQFRLWQVQSMASIAKLTFSLLMKIQVPLQTTQLLFVHSGTIDISFRNDERRFDVEGSYNIRYQMVKKRIDKVNINSTGQRLTQPGKIAIVYSIIEDGDEYCTYIQALQQQNILMDDLEYLELQELQGVTGLRALRVGVRI